jgi:soluble lytic murein transglycosylase-like protein
MKWLKWLVYGGLGYLAYRALFAKRLPGSALNFGCKGPPQKELAQQLAEKWGKKFGVAPEVMMVIGRIESGYRPRCVTTDVRALKRGGAWGMWQQTFATAKGHAAALKSSDDAEVQATLRKWTGRPAALFDPELNAMFAAKQLGTLSRRYGGNFNQIVGAYHQGAGKIDQMIRDKKKIPEELPPHGKVYVSRALKVRAQIG